MSLPLGDTDRQKASSGVCAIAVIVSKLMTEVLVHVMLGGNMTRAKWVLLVIGVWFIWPPSDAEAIAAWSRKYNLDCSACHAGPMYKLTPLGADFLRRGHRVADDEVTPDWAKLFSINTKLRAYDSNAPGRNSSIEVHAFSVYTGGVLSEHFSYFTEMYLYENTGRTTGAVNSDFGRGKLADAYLMMTSHPNSDVYTTVKVGQISPSQLLIYWNVGPRYTETRPYIVNNSQVAPNSYRPFIRNFGVEVAQTAKNLHGAFGFLNGTGAATTNSVDNNESKDVYGTIDYVLDDQGSAVGFYGYRGKDLITPTTGSPWENTFHRIGGFVQVVRGQLNVTGAVSQGTEQLTWSGIEADNRGYLLEADYHINDRIAAFGRYDYFDPNRRTANDHLDGPVFGATYRFFDPGRIVFEWHKQGRKPASGSSRPWEYRFEIAFMF